MPLTKFKKYGKTYGRYDGVKPVIVTKDLEIMKSVLVKNFDSFHEIFTNEKMGVSFIILL